MQDRPLYRQTVRFEKLSREITGADIVAAIEVANPTILTAPLDKPQTFVAYDRARYGSARRRRSWDNGWGSQLQLPIEECFGNLNETSALWKTERQNGKFWGAGLNLSLLDGSDLFHEVATFSAVVFTSWAKTSEADRYVRDPIIATCNEAVASFRYELAKLLCQDKTEPVDTAAEFAKEHLICE